MARFTLHGIFASGPTYKVGLMLNLTGTPFDYEHVDLRSGAHKADAFLAKNRYGQVPSLRDRQTYYVQSAAILEHLSDSLKKFDGIGEGIHGVSDGIDRVTAVVLAHDVRGERSLQPTSELAERLGEAVAASALQEAQHPVDDRGRDAVAGEDGGVVDAANRLVGGLGVELDARAISHCLASSGMSARRRSALSRGSRTMLANGPKPSSMTRRSPSSSSFRVHA